MTLPNALREAIAILKAEGRNVFLLSDRCRYRLSPSRQHPRGYEIWLSVFHKDAWQPWSYAGNFDVADVLIDAWSVQHEVQDQALAIQLHVVRPDGHHYDIDLVRESVLPVMWEAVEDCVHALTTGERLLPKDLYDLVAHAFDVPRDEAKRRILASSYGMSSAQIARVTTADPNEPQLIGWTWKAHLTQLHDDVRAGRWIQVSKTLSLMLGHAVDKMVKEHA